MDDVLVDSKNSSILPGVKRLLIDLRISGMKLAVTSKKSGTKNILKNLSIQNYFDVILSSDDLNVAMEPLLLETVEGLNLLPENCVIFDSLSDILKEAKKLNMGAIGVGTDLLSSFTDKVVPNLSNVNSLILKF